jgi:hypothetical protein
MRIRELDVQERAVAEEPVSQQLPAPTPFKPSNILGVQGVGLLAASVK